MRIKFSKKNGKCRISVSDKHDEVTLWQRIIIHLKENNRKHFSDNIASLMEQYKVSERRKKKH